MRNVDTIYKANKSQIIFVNNLTFMHNHNKLIVYQKALKLIPTIYNLTNLLPHTEKFGLISQLNRAAVSVSSNIAEGASRDSDKEFVHYLA
jgi:hypothetical protein